MKGYTGGKRQSTRDAYMREKKRNIRARVCMRNDKNLEMHENGKDIKHGR